MQINGWANIDRTNKTKSQANHEDVLLRGT